ncbi:MAG: peptidoglycan-binding protein [bacterium]|nr:peptidoglycan-binding protein [bacterium]
MNKLLKPILTLAVLLSILSAPAVTQAVSGTSSAQELITSLEAQIAKLRTQIIEMNVQIESLRQVRGEIKETVKEIKGTIKIIRNLRMGMSGDDIKSLQELLATDSDVYPEKLITGYFGKMTERAIKKLQRKLCLEEVGSVGPKTMARINELLEEGAGSSGKIPPGLLTAPGIQKKLCGTSTPDTTAPVISDITATSTTATTTQIQWLTDEKANSKVWYGISTPVDTTTSTAMISSSDNVLNHSITLSDLTASTTYYYVIASTDKSDNTATATEKSFTTLEQ